MVIQFIASNILRNPVVQKEAGELLGFVSEAVGGALEAETIEGLDLATRFLEHLKGGDSKLTESLRGQLTQKIQALGTSLNGEATQEEKALLGKLVSILEKGKVTPDADDIKGLIEIATGLDIPTSFTSSTLEVPNTPLNSIQPQPTGHTPETNGKDIPEAEQATTGKVYTQAELDAEVEKKVEAELKKRVVENREAGTKNLDSIEKIITGIGGVVTGEFKNMNSEVGWLMKAFCKWKGITINEEVVGNYLRGFANDTFQNNLKTFIKAKVSGHKDPLSLCTGLSENDKTSIKWAGTLITIGGSTPAWVFDGVALLGTAIDYGAEFMHGIPVLGTILKFPFGRKLITGVGQFAGRFAKDIQLIGTGARELKAAGAA